MGLGALAVGLFANLVARHAKRPASLPLLPGIVLLVRGSLGFKSLLSMLEHNVLTGVETAFRMALIAVALVTGLLVAGAIVSPRRPL